MVLIFWWIFIIFGKENLISYKFILEFMILISDGNVVNGYLGGCFFFCKIFNNFLLSLFIF